MSTESNGKSFDANSDDILILEEKSGGQTNGCSSAENSTPQPAKKRPRERDSMPNTPRSPPKRTRKNSIGSGTPSQPSTPGTGPTPSDKTRQTGPDKAKAPAGMDDATKEFFLAMESRLTNRIDGIHDKVKDNSESIRALKESQDTMKLDINREFVKQKRDTKIEIDRAIAGIQGPITGAPRMTTQQEESYDFHRRSLRMWPIKGPSFSANVRTFLMDKLKLTPDFLVEIGNIEVKRYYDTRQPAAKTNTRSAAAAAASSTRSPLDEAIVTFATKECRDKVKAAGVNLAGQQEAGIRIHVPGFLMDSFNAFRVLATT